MKNHTKLFKGVLALLAAGLFLAACSGGAPATPTTDPNMILTQVAETVMASITQTVAAMPTSTAVPTNTPVPTPIPLPTQDLSMVPTESPINYPSIPTATSQHYGNWAAWFGQSPADGQNFAPLQVITFHGCMRNIGDTIWNSNYYLMYVSGPNLSGGTKTWRVGKAVKPGDSWCWDIYATMPGSKGNYTTRYYFYSDQNQKMFGATGGEVFFTYNVS